MESLTKEVEKIEEEVCDNDGAKSNKSFSGENPRHRIICNLAQTEYDVIKKVARKVCNWRIKYFLEDTMGAVINYNNVSSIIYNIASHHLRWHINFEKLLNVMSSNFTTLYTDQNLGNNILSDID